MGKNEVTEKYAELAKSISDNLHIVDDSIVEKEGHAAYYANLPEGVTKSTIKAITGYNGKFVTAAHVAVADIASELFKKDKKRETVLASVGFFGASDSIGIKVDRSKTFTNHLAKEGDSKEVVKPLYMSTSVDIRSGKGNSLKAIKDELGTMFAGTFK